MCDAPGKKKKRHWRPLQLKSKSPILNANLVGSDYPCLELLSKQAVIQIYFDEWGSSEGIDAPVGTEEKHGKRSVALLHMLPTIRKQFFSFMSRSKIVRQHMCWP